MVIALSFFAMIGFIIGLFLPIWLEVIMIAVCVFCIVNFIRYGDNGPEGEGPFWWVCFSAFYFGLPVSSGFIMAILARLIF